MAITFTKITRTDEWGLRSTTKLEPGNQVSVRKGNGTHVPKYVGPLVWTNNSTFIYEIARAPKPQPAPRAYESRFGSPVIHHNVGMDEGNADIAYVLGADAIIAASEIAKEKEADALAEAAPSIPAPTVKLDPVETFMKITGEPRVHAEIAVKHVQLGMKPVRVIEADDFPEYGF